VSRNDHRVGLLYSLIVITSIVYSPISQGEATGEYLLFPHIGANFRSELANDSLLDSDDYTYGVDIFATASIRDFLFLGELLLAKHEQDFERLQLGWMAGDSKVWLGRFHNPVGYWNTEFHHGSFLETGISRPSIVEFEHDNGLLPMHLTGLLVEGVIEHDKQGLGYALAAGAGPELSDKLEALEILDPGSGSHDLSLTLNLYLEPVIYAPTRYGLFVNYTEIPSIRIGLDEIRQFSAGVYGNWEAQRWRLTGSTFYLRNRLQQLNGELTDSFFSSYFQADFKPDDHWTIFGRVEWAVGDENDAYLALFPQHINDRILGGVRLDAFDRHAFKLEISGNRTQGDNFGQFMLQWAAMF
jgi:hypothetical protein